MSITRVGLRGIAATNRLAVLVALVLIAMLAGGCGSSNGDSVGSGGSNGGGGDLADRVVDDRAGLSYILPLGWEKRPSEDLLDSFTSLSSMETGSGGNGGLLALGPVERSFADKSPDLATMAEGLAADFAEFFVPFQGERRNAADEALQVGGNDAHRVLLEIVPEDSPPAIVEVVVVKLDGGPAFALGVISPRDGTMRWNARFRKLWSRSK
ncbi:MAG TPA: hypothetical protein VF711_08335 [Acidimicrobiales bacterium]|jgi:hypothetical protein